MAANHKHDYGPVVSTDEDGTEEKFEACRICGAKKRK